MPARRCRTGRSAQQRNLVTRRGLQLIEAEIARHQRDLARARADADREAAGRASRELRYWSARRTSAEVAEPEPGRRNRRCSAPRSPCCGTTTRELTLRIVGEDEADPADGRIAWTTPVARAILGSRPGEVRELPTGTVEIVSIDPAPEPVDGR